MKVIILHGDDSVKISSRLQTFRKAAKKRGWEIHETDEKINFEELVRSQSLFGNERIVIFPIKLLPTKKSKWLKEKRNDFSFTLVLYSYTKLTPSKLKSYSFADKIEEHAIPQVLWKFLDSFYPGNAANTLFLFNNACQATNEHIVFEMLSRQVRDMFLVNYSPESLSMPDWKKAKLVSQSDKFSDNNLEDIIEEMAKIDILSKTTSAELKNLIDFMIIKELK